MSNEVEKVIDRLIEQESPEELRGSAGEVVANLRGIISLATRMLKTLPTKARWRSMQSKLEDISFELGSVQRTYWK